MSSIFKTLASGTIAVILASSMFAAAQAEELPDRGPVPFHLYDKDGNNLISEEEFYDLRAQRMQKRADDGFPMRGAANAPDFSEFDGNNDGMLTPEELQAGQQAQMSQRRGGGGMRQGPGAK